MNNPQRIGIDCRFAGTKAGLGRYTRELVKALLRRSDAWQYVLFRKEDADDDLDAAINAAQLQATSYKLQARHYSLAEQLLLPRLIKKTGIDLFHSLHFNVPLRCPVPYVVTIHDLILHHYPNDASLGRRLAYRFLMKQAVKRASHIIAISEFTKGDLLNQYPFLRSTAPNPNPNPNPHISAIPEGISAVFAPASRGQQEYIRDEWHLPENYFLYVGNAKEHKNVQTLIDAFAKLTASQPEPGARRAEPRTDSSTGTESGAGRSRPTLILVSHGKEVERLRLIPNVRILGEAEDLHLRALYTGAVAFVLPSLYEGLGLPCLEAMACGCPVIASNAASVPETCGVAAFLVEPTVEGLSDAMLTLLKLHPESKEREEIVEKGLRRAREFTWERTAELTANVYRNILETIEKS